MVSAKQRKTLERVFKHPILRNITYEEVESLAENVGCMIESPRGSAVKFTKNGIPFTIHKPHNREDVCDRLTIKRFRKFLRNIGATE